MTDLYRPQSYPPEARAKLERMRSQALKIANRWMMGWPKRVKALLDSGQYLELLESQTEIEVNALANPHTSHLAGHEIAELYGLSLKPPAP